MGKMYRHLTKIYTLPISMRRARIFKKLLSDIYVQIGHIQWWFWALVKLKNEKNANGMSNIHRFISEMNELFKASNIGSDSDEQLEDVQNKNVIELFIEMISFS